MGHARFTCSRIVYRNNTSKKEITTFYSNPNEARKKQTLGIAWFTGFNVSGNKNCSERLSSGKFNGKRKEETFFPKHEEEKKIAYLLWRLSIRFLSKFNFSSCNNKKSCKLSLQVASCSQPSHTLKVTADSVSRGGARQRCGGMEFLAQEHRVLKPTRPGSAAQLLTISNQLTIQPNFSVFFYKIML